MAGQGRASWGKAGPPQHTHGHPGGADPVSVAPALHAQTCMCTRVSQSPMRQPHPTHSTLAAQPQGRRADPTHTHTHMHTRTRKTHMSTISCMRADTENAATSASERRQGDAAAARRHPPANGDAGGEAGPDAEDLRVSVCCWRIPRAEVRGLSGWPASGAARGEAGTDAEDLRVSVCCWRIPRADVRGLSGWLASGAARGEAGTDAEDLRVSVCCLRIPRADVRGLAGCEAWASTTRSTRVSVDAAEVAPVREILRRVSCCMRPVPLRPRPDDHDCIAPGATQHPSRQGLYT
jgi:hypothetical protein